MNIAKDPTKRFSDKVANYIKYRPGYPKEILALMKSKMGLKSEHIIADLGSGTGIFAKLLLQNSNAVYGVEPNTEMREAAQNFLKDFSGFKSINGTAEQTTLSDHSMDFVTAAQAAHWFDVPKVREECLRVLKPEGFGVLIWNERKFDSSEFLKDYEALLKKYGTDYEKVKHTYAGAQDAFFGSKNYKKDVFENKQVFDFEGLTGRLLSSSYIASNPSHPSYSPMIDALNDIFLKYAKNNQVVFEYRTIVYWGRLKA